ncbi:MAG: flagellar basal body rod protein FlgB [Nitrospiraceae bacterium]|nr:flagellar basal body rod protein FlgB [Nitrospiraceae bacterium]
MSALSGIDAGQLLIAGMRVASENHRIIANNIANVDTPNFNPTEMDFQKTLSKLVEGQGRLQLRRTRPRHFDKLATPPQFERLAFLSKNDYNKVDLDDQMVKLSENTGRYTTYGSLLVKRFEQIKSMLQDLR